MEHSEEKKDYVAKTKLPQNVLDAYAKLFEWAQEEIDRRSNSGDEMLIDSADLALVADRKPGRPRKNVVPESKKK
jgi:hypothetical protein